MPGSASLPRRLSDGLYARLEFDFACNRGHAFSEYHMYGALIEILASNFNKDTTDIRPGFPLAAIQRNGISGGREVDFAVMGRSTSPHAPELEVCIEAKWANSSHARATTILRDVTRLAIVKKAHPDSQCLFILAGGKSAVKEKLGQLASLRRAGASPLAARERDKLLLEPVHTHYEQSFALRNSSRGVAHLDPKHLRALEDDYDVVPSVIPNVVKSFHYKPSHDVRPNWSVAIWRIFV